MRMAPASSGVQRHPAEYKAEPLSPPPAAQGPFRAARSLGPCARGESLGARTRTSRPPDLKAKPRQSQKSKPRAPQTQEPGKTFRAESFQGENFIGHGGRGAPLVQTWCATPVGQMLFCINNCDFEIETTSQSLISPRQIPGDPKGSLFESKTHS